MSTRSPSVVYDAVLFPGIGGGARHFEGLARALERAGTGLTLILTDPTAVELGEGDTNVITIPVPWRGRVLRQLRYELGRVILFLRWWITGKRVDIWIARHSLFGLGLPLARLVARQVVLEVNGPVLEETYSNFGSRTVSCVAEACFRLQVAGASTVVAVSPGLSAYVYRRNRNKRVLVVPNGSDPPDEEVSRRGSKRTVDRERLVFLGALTPWYDLETVIRATALLHSEGRPLELDIIGDGASKSRLESLIVELNAASYVRMLGWLPAADARRRMGEGGVGLLPLRPKHPGLDAIGSPLKLYEYVAAGLRVVGTNVDGISGAPVSAAVDLYEPGDMHQCALAIARALEGQACSLPAELWSWDARASHLLAALGGGLGTAWSVSPGDA